MPNPIVHVEFQVSDARKAQEWYGNLFGWKMQYVEQMNYVLFEGDDGSVGGGLNPGGQMSGTVVYIRVEDIHAMVARARDAGAEILLDVKPVPGVGQIALFKDPDGNMIGLIDDSEAARGG